MSCSRPRRLRRCTWSALPSSGRRVRDGSPTCATRSSRTRIGAPSGSSSPRSSRASTSSRRSLELQRDSEALLLLIPEADGRGRGVLSGKVFEYLAAQRPILALVPPDGAAARLLEETGAGLVVAPDDVEGMVRELTALRDRWQAGTLDGT